MKNNDTFTPSPVSAVEHFCNFNIESYTIINTDSDGKVTFSQTIKSKDEALKNCGLYFVRSILKKIDNTTCNPTIHAMRIGLQADIDTLSKIDRLTREKTSEIRYRKDGSMYFKKLSNRGTVNTALWNACKTPLHGEGLSLVSLATAELTDRINRIEKAYRHTANRPSLLIDFSMPYIVRRPYKKTFTVANGDTKTITKMKAEKTCLHSDVWKTVRNAIIDYSSKETPLDGYAREEKEITDPITGEKHTVYIRMEKYADIYGSVELHSDKKGVTLSGRTDSASFDTVSEMYRKITAELNTRQLQVMKYRIKGLSLNEIAKRLNCEKKSVARSLNQIQEKCKKLGYDPTK